MIKIVAFRLDRLLQHFPAWDTPMSSSQVGNGTHTARLGRKDNTCPDQAKVMTWGGWGDYGLKETSTGNQTGNACCILKYRGVLSKFPIIQFSEIWKFEETTNIHLSFIYLFVYLLIYIYIIYIYICIFRMKKHGQRQ